MEMHDTFDLTSSLKSSIQQKNKNKFLRIIKLIQETNKTNEKKDGDELFFSEMLEFAIIKKTSMEILELLVSHFIKHGLKARHVRVDKKRQAMMHVCFENGNYKMLFYLLELSKREPVLFEILDPKSHNVHFSGFNLLHSACYGLNAIRDKNYKDFDLLGFCKRMIEDYGLDVNAQDEHESCTPAHMLVSHKLREHSWARDVLELFLKHGLDLLIQSKFGNSVLHSIYYYENQDLYSFLLERVNPEKIQGILFTKNKLGDNILHNAIIKDHDQGVKSLIPFYSLYSGGRIKQENGRDGLDYLSMCNRYGRLETFKILVEDGGLFIEQEENVYQYAKKRYEFSLYHTNSPDLIDLALQRYEYVCAELQFKRLFFLLLFFF